MDGTSVINHLSVRTLADLIDCGQDVRQLVEPLLRDHHLQRYWIEERFRKPLDLAFHEEASSLVISKLSLQAYMDERRRFEQSGLRRLSREEAARVSEDLEENITAYEQLLIRQVHYRVPGQQRERGQKWLLCPNVGEPLLLNMKRGEFYFLSERTRPSPRSEHPFSLASMTHAALIYAERVSKYVPQGLLADHCFQYLQLKHPKK